MHQFLFSLPIVMSLHALASVWFRTFDSGWRWFAVRDILALCYSATASAATSIVVLRIFGMQDDWRSIILLYAFFVLAFTAGLRFFMRLLRGIRSWRRSGPGELWCSAQTERPN